MDRLIDELFDDKPMHHCGLVAVHSNEDINVVPLGISSLRGMQGRGQEGYGIVTENSDDVFRKEGLVPEISHLDLANLPSGNKMIGHNMYTTSSLSSVENLQPIRVEYQTEIGKRFFYLAHNGTVETDILVPIIEENGYRTRENEKDTVLMGKRLAQLMEDRNDWIDTFKAAEKEVKGSYSIVILTDDEKTIAFRGGGVCRPLCLGWHEETNSHMIVSESTGLDYADAKLERDVNFGEIILIDKTGLHSYQITDGIHVICPFEYTYFSHPASIEDGRGIYGVRFNLGKSLATKYENYIDSKLSEIKEKYGKGWKEKIRVIPVPDSARPASLGFSEKSGIPYDEGLIKNRYRSFIEPDRNGREKIVGEIIPIRDVVEGRYVIVIDDSIVRGTSSRIIVGKLYEAGALGQSWFLTFRQ